MRYILLISVLFSWVFPYTPVGKTDEVVCRSELDGPMCDDRNSLNGYWWYGFWVPGLVSYETQITPTPIEVVGGAVFYAPEVMEATAAYRGLSLDGYVGAVSALTCANIGMSVWIKRSDAPWEGPFLVVDCSRRNDLYAQVNYLGMVVEVDFNTWVRWGLGRYGGNDNGGRWTAFKQRIDNVIVSKYPPESAYLLNPVDIKDWFNRIVTFANSYGGNLLYKGGSSWLLNYKYYMEFKQPIPIRFVKNKNKTPD